MANIPNAPGMGVHPTLLDISRYNLWAARYGQPIWGANAAPAVPPPPPPAAPARRGGWQKGRPRGVPPPAPHGDMAAGPANANEKWRPGTEERGRKTYAQLANGQWRMVRIFNSITGQYRATPIGEDYYRNNRQEFIFEIPVICYGYKGPNTIERFRNYMKLTEEYILTHCPHLDHHNLQGVFGAGRVRDRLSGPAAVQAAITEAVHQYLDGIQEKDSEGRSVLMRASDGWYVYDPTRPIRFSEQIVRHIRDDGTPVIENILDRPLQGFPAQPSNMYQKLGLCEIAMHDLKDRGGCMVAQIYECAKKRHNVGRTGSGRMGTRSNGHYEQQKLFKDPKEIEDLFDQIFADLYPGEPMEDLFDQVLAELGEPVNPGV